jgi:hypothetical protein
MSHDLIFSCLPDSPPARNGIPTASFFGKGKGKGKSSTAAPPTEAPPAQCRAQKAAKKPAKEVVASLTDEERAGLMRKIKEVEKELEKKMAERKALDKE